MRSNAYLLRFALNWRMSRLKDLEICLYSRWYWLLSSIFWGLQNETMSFLHELVGEVRDFLGPFLTASFERCWFRKLVPLTTPSAAQRAAVHSFSDSIYVTDYTEPLRGRYNYYVCRHNWIYIKSKLIIFFYSNKICGRPNSLFGVIRKL